MSDRNDNIEPLSLVPEEGEWECCGTALLAEQHRHDWQESPLVNFVGRQVRYRDMLGIIAVEEGTAFNDVILDEEPRSAGAGSDRR